MSVSSFVGMENQLRRELASWWRGGRWRKQALIWFAILVGLLAIMLWVLPRALAGVEGGEVAVLDPEEAAAQFTELATVMAVIGATILSQGLLIDDRRSGIMEWVLSKPLSRAGLIISKFIGQVVGMVVTAVIIPWLGVWVLLSIARGSPWPVTHWLQAVGLISLLVGFQIALVLALSAISWSRGLVLGLPMAMVVGSDLLTGVVPAVAPFNVYLLGRIAAATMVTGQTRPIGPLVSAVVGTVVLIWVARWRLDAYEF